MSFLNKLKSAFGIAPEESDMEYEAAETPRTPYINPSPRQKLPPRLPLRKRSRKARMRKRSRLRRSTAV